MFEMEREGDPTHHPTPVHHLDRFLALEMVVLLTFVRMHADVEFVIAVEQWDGLEVEGDHAGSLDIVDVLVHHVRVRPDDQVAVGIEDDRGKPHRRSVRSRRTHTRS